MVSLAQDSQGNYRARKRLPNDVREDYSRLYGPRLEAKFSAPASTKPHVAKQRFGEWLSEVEGRIAAIRAQRKGEGLSLTREQTRALSAKGGRFARIRFCSLRGYKVAWFQLPQRANIIQDGADAGSTTTYFR